jgi:CHAT domain-containing protein
MASYEQALAITREVGNRDWESLILSNLGEVHYALKQYEQAIAYLEQALALAREVGTRVGEADVLTNLMRLWKDQQHPQLAIFYGKQAVNILQSIRGEVQTLDKALQQRFLTSTEDVYRTLAELLITEGRLPEAQQVLDLLKDEEYFDFVRRNAQTTETLQGRATLTPKEAEWVQRYQAIADRVTAIGREWGTLRAKKPKQGSLTVAEEQQLQALAADISVAQQAFDQLLKELAAAFDSTDEARQRVADAKVETGLKADLAEMGPGTVSLYTLVTKERYRVIVITATTQVARDYPISAEALNCKIYAFRKALGAIGSGAPVFDPRPLAQELYQILLGPVARDLEGANAQTLMWELDGGLRYLPVAALYDGKQYLVEHYRNVVYTPTSKPRLKDTPSPTWTGLGLGVSQAHKNFEALLAVPQELHGIIRETEHDTDGVLPGVIKMDGAFTAKAMFTALEQSYPLVHIASHFRFRPGDETQSFLLLGDGSHLSLEQFKVQPDMFHGVELLTLSACDTAMGGPEGTGKEVESFAVLAQRQGAKAVVATLWPVADTSTKDLMQAFYRLRESQPGMPKGEALRQAQLTLLRGQGASPPGPPVAALSASPSGETSATLPRGDLEPLPQAQGACGDVPRQPRFVPSLQAPYAHPYYWAPFILIGNWK